MKKCLTLFLVLALPLFIAAQQVTTLSSGGGADDALLFDSLGRLYGAHYQGSAIFRLSPPNWNVETFSTGYNTPNGLAFGRDGFLYMADNRGNRIYRIAADGTKTVFVDNFFNPSGLLFELDSDTLLVTSYEGNRIVKIAPDGGQVEWSKDGLFNGPVGLCYDDDRRLYTSNFNNLLIIRLDEDGSQDSLIQIPGSGQLGFIAYAKGYIYATLFDQHKIYRTDLDGNGSVFLGGGPGTADGDASTARFNTPNGIVASPSQDTLYVSDYGRRALRMITELQPVSTSTSLTQQITMSLQLSPNPADSIVRLNLEFQKEQAVTIRILDQTGKLIQMLYKQQLMSVGKKIIPIPIDQFPIGMYLIQVETSDREIISESFIKS